MTTTHRTGPGAARRLLLSAMLSTSLMAAGCTDSDSSADSPGGRASETPSASSAGGRPLALADYDGLRPGPAIERSTDDSQTRLLALAPDGAALVLTCPKPKGPVDGVFAPAGQLTLVQANGKTERLPGAERAVDAADATARHVVWTEFLGPVRDGLVSLTGRTPPEQVLRSYDRRTGTVRTLAQLDPGDEFSSPLVVGDRAVWSVQEKADAAAIVSSRPLDTGGAARREVAARATASDGERLWYTTWTPDASAPALRIIRRDLTARTDKVVHDLILAPKDTPGALAAAPGAVAWSVAGPDGHRLMVSDTGDSVREIATGPLAFRALHASAALVGYGDSPDAESDADGRLWLLDRERDVIVDLGTSCCPLVLVAGPHVVWDDGSVLHRATLRP